MADNGTVLLTHKHIGTQAVRFYFSLTGVKGLEGLNKLCLCPCTWEHEYPRMHGLSSISASWSRSKLKNKEYQTNGGSLTYKQWYAPTATHLTLYLTPYISPKPMFLPKIVTQSPIFFTLSRILEIFHSKTPNRLEFEKKVLKMPPIFMAFVTERPPIFCLAYTCLFQGNVAPSNTVIS